jgi:hypothetical protein
VLQKKLQLKELDERLTSVESERLANKNSLLTEQNFYTNTNQ